MDWIGVGFLCVCLIALIAAINDRSVPTPPPEPVDRERWEYDRTHVEDNHSTKRNSFD